MSSIDERIVQLELDNKDFEKNASISMKTLDRIKDALNFGKTSNERSLEGISTAVEGISNRFSNLGIVGMTALQNLTNYAIRLGSKLTSAIFNPIVEGGKKRALNLEEAQFRLKGLGVEWNKISKDVDYGVKDTAYSLDSAAKAASMLVASGIEFGDTFGTTGNSPMAKALRGISGVAAMTNATYDDIANVYTDIAAAGRLTGDAVTRLTQRSLPVLQTLSKQFGKTQEEVKKMVTDGKIDFQTFATAMDDAFGQHAKDANKTFTGAMSNIRAALARTGAMFATPIMQNAIPVLNSFRTKINEINKALKPVADRFEQIIKAISSKLTKKIEGINLNLPWLDNILTSANILIHTLKVLGTVIHDSFVMTFLRYIKTTNGEIVSVSGTINRKLTDVSEKIKSFSMIIRDFITKNRDKLERTFKGFFAIFDIAKTILQKFAKVLKPVFGIFGEGTDGILSVTAAIGDFIVKVSESIKQSKLLSFIFDTLTNGFTKIGSGINKAKEGISVFFKDLKEKFSSKNLTEGILGFFTSLKEGILNTFDKADIDKAVKTGLFGTMVYWVKRLSGNVFSLKQLFSGEKTSIWVTIKHTLDQLKDSLFSWQQELNASRLLKIGGAIAILAAGLWVLSSIPASKLAKATTAMAGLFSMLMGSLKIFEKYFDPKKMMRLSMASGIFTSLSTAIVIMSLAMKILASISWDGIARGIVAMAGICTIIVATSKLLENSSRSLKNGAKALIPFAISMVIFGASFKIFETISWEGIVKSLLSMAGIIATISVLAAATKKTRRHITDLAKSMVIFGASMIIFAKAFELFSQFSPSDILKSLASMAGIFAEVLIVSAINKKIGDKNLKKLGVSMILIGAAMKIFANVISVLSSIDGKGILTSLGAMAGLFALVLIFSKLAPKNLISVGAGMTVMAIAVRLLASSMLLLGKMSWSDIIRGLTTLAGIFVILGVAALVLKPLLPAIAALAGIIALLGVAAIGLGTGLTLLSKSIMLLATMAMLSFTTIISNMGEFVKVLPKIGKKLIGFTLILTPLIPFLALLATSILFLGAGIVALGVGLNILSKAIDLWESSASDKFTSILDVFGSIISGILETLKEYTPKIVDAAFLLITSLLEGINSNMERITELSILIIANFINGIADGLPALIDAGYKLMVSYIDGLATAIDENTDSLISAMDHLGISMMNALIKVFTHYYDIVKHEGLKLMLKLKLGIREKIDDIKTAGKDLIEGFIQGIKDKISAAVDAVKGLGSKVVNGLKEKLGINSPSKEFAEVGRYSDMGLARGLVVYSKLASDAAKDVGESTVNSLSDSLSNVSAIFTDDDFTIKPILDLSDVNKKSKMLNSMLSGNRTYSLASSVGNANVIDFNKASGKEISQFNFTQNNYSPKALSRVDIYRQTKNQFSQLKELVSS